MTENSDSSTTSDSDSDSDGSGGGGIRRRDVLVGLGLAGLAGYSTLEDSGIAGVGGTAQAVVADDPRVLNAQRADRVVGLRQQVATRVRERASADAHPVVADHGEPEGYLYRFTRCLPHNADGTVNEEDYNSYLDALHSGTPEAWGQVNRGGTRPFIDPVASTTVPMLGMDTHEVALDSPPEIDSETVAAELVELYWQSLLRDVPFSEYPNNDIAQQAAADLNTYADVLPGNDGEITPENLFRGPLEGSEFGPHVSQFFLKDIPFGAHEVEQQIRVAAPGIDFVDNRALWLSTLNGTSLPDGDIGLLANGQAAPITDEQQFDEQRRFIRTGRDMSSCVHRDFVPGQFLLAINHILGRPVDGVPGNPGEVYDANNPEIDNDAVHTFVNYARTGMSDLITRAARMALMAAWFQKWQVHRRARPEKLGGLIDMHLSGDHDYGDLFHPSLFESEVFDVLEAEQGNWLLTQAYAEGAPAHPAYPGGHATVAGAAGTILKAVLNEDHVIEDPIQPTPNGLDTIAYTGDDANQLTVRHEVHKLIDNVNIIGRHMAGVHYRTDTLASYQLGEQVAIRLLQDVRDQTREAAHFEFTDFSGEAVRI